MSLRARNLSLACVLAILSGCGSSTAGVDQGIELDGGSDLANAGMDASADEAVEPLDDGGTTDGLFDAGAPDLVQTQFSRFAFLQGNDGASTSLAIDSATGLWRPISLVFGGNPDARLHPSALWLGTSGGLTGKIGIVGVDGLNGVLSVQAATQPAITTATSFAWHPGGAYFYVGTDTPDLLVYTFDPGTGASSLLQTVTLPSHPLNLAADPGGKAIYAGLTDHSIQALSIGGDGKLAVLGTPTAALAQAPQLRVCDSGGLLAASAKSAGTVQLYTIGATGALTAGGTVTLPGSAQRPAFAPDCRHVFASSSAKIYGFSVTAGTAALTATVPASIDSGAGIDTITVDAPGRRLYVIHKAINQAQVFSIAFDGALSLAGAMRIRGESLTVEVSPAGVPLKLDATAAVVANYNGNNLTRYTMDPSTGALSAPSTSTAIAGPFQVLVDQRGSFAYALSAAEGVRAYQIFGAAGIEQVATGSPAATTNAAYSMAQSPSGHDLYVATYRTNPTAQQSIDHFVLDPATGIIGAKSVFVSGLLAKPDLLQVDPTGSYLWVHDSGNLFAFSIEPFAGTLTALPGFPVALGASATAIAFSTNGEHGYVTLANGTLLGYAIDKFGDVTAVAGTPAAVGSSPGGVAVDPFGRFVYATDTGPFSGVAHTTLYGFSRNASTGALAPLTTPTFASGARPISLAIEPGGRFLLGACTGTVGPTVAAALSQYGVASTGLLTPLGGMPAVGNTPYSVAFVGRVH